MSIHYDKPIGSGMRKKDFKKSSTGHWKIQLADWTPRVLKGSSTKFRVYCGKKRHQRPNPLRRAA